LNNDLALDDGRAAAKPSRCFCYAWIAVGPVEVVAGVRACLASLDKKKGSVPVMLDLVDPTRTRRRMIDCGCELRPDKLQRHSIDLSEAGEIASRQLLPLLERDPAKEFQAA